MRLPTAILICVLAPTLCLKAWWVWDSRDVPPIPTQWLTLEAGMTRQQVIETIPDPISDIRELKGFDMASRGYQYRGADYGWSLFITYDDDGLVESVDARTGNELSGHYDQRRTIVD